MARPSQSSGVW
jgi:hypothetical protein